MQERRVRASKNSIGFGKWSRVETETQPPRVSTAQAINTVDLRLHHSVRVSMGLFYIFVDDGVKTEE